MTTSLTPRRTGTSQSAVPAGTRTIGIEVEALKRLRGAMAVAPLAPAFDAVAHLIANAAGRVIVTGMGKSGHVGRKMAATFASTGTPAMFLHPAEASHGDLGMITRDDIVLALSWSGESEELSDVVSYARRFEVPLVSATSRADSSLARQSSIVMVLPVVCEACPNQLAPTSSTIVQAALGDALAVALIEVRGFSPDDFRRLHPRGRLGAQLLRVGDLIEPDAVVPQVTANATILNAMLEMSRGRVGITSVVDDKGKLVGALTDGDLRRSLTNVSVDAPVRDHMTIEPLTIGAERLASEALALMNARNVTQLFVRDQGRLAGVLHVHDVLRAGVA